MHDLSQPTSPFTKPLINLNLSFLKQPEDFPELEILWLLTRAWNTGILLYSLAQYPEAERWCGLGMSFLRHLGSLQDSYQTQVTQQDVGGGYVDGVLRSCLNIPPKVMDFIFVFLIPFGLKSGVFSVTSVGFLISTEVFGR